MIRQEKFFFLVKIFSIENFFFADSSMTMADSSKLFNSNRSPLGASSASAISVSANSANHSDTEAIDEDDDDLVNDHVI